MREELVIKPLEDVNPAEYPDAVRAYFIHYGLDGAAGTAEHLFGSFRSDDYTLAAHLYRPRAYTATVVLVHGYLNHAGQFRHLIAGLLDGGFAVAVFDLPGHGLSSGQRGEIETFEQYVQAVEDFRLVVQAHLNGPYHAVGFSTGAAILIEMLLAGRADAFERIVLAAPLIHWTLYEQSKGTYKVYSAFTDRIARFHRRNSSDRDFLNFNRTQDYLHVEHLSLKWVKALFDWNERLENRPACDTRVLVLQGDRDGTVDWHYNLNLVGRKFPNAHVEMIEGANHELFNESPEYRGRAIDKGIEFLTSKTEIRIN